MKNKSRIRIAGALLITSIALAVSCAIREINYCEFSDQPYASFMSPDGRFKIEVYAHKKGGLLPGQAGDVPGVVVLKDAKEKILNRKCIEMVQLVDNPTWSSARVEQKLIFDWALP